MTARSFWALSSLFVTLLVLSCGDATIGGSPGSGGRGGTGNTAGQGGAGSPGAGAVGPSTGGSLGGGGTGPSACSAAGQMQCNGVCTDLSSNAQNCGTCGVLCQPGEACGAGQCQCLPGLLDCGGTCVNTASDGLHCGPSCAPCVGGEVCSLGVCKPDCDEGLELCGESSCADLTSDSFNCGQCGAACPTGQACVDGECECPTGLSNCNMLCVNTTTDPGNCGGCDIVCDTDEMCTPTGCASTGAGGTAGSGGGGGSGGSSGSTSGGSSGAGGSGSCTDVPPDNVYTCAQQAGWGKCNETWMVGFCNLSCQRCGGSGGSSGAGGSGGSSGAGGSAGSAGTGGSGGGCGVQPVNPNTNQTTRNVLCYLYENYGQNVLSGQQDCSWSSPGDIEYVNSNTGEWPAIIGGDLLYDDAVSQSTSYWNAGGLSMIRYHMGRPGEGDGYDESQMEISESEFAQALTPGTSLNDDLMSKFDKAANKLAQLQSAGVTVIYAPWHEIDPNSWFWWGMGTTEQFKQLWRLMYDDFTARGLNNLIWLLPFSGSPSAVFHPGAAYVDMSGGDTYGSGQPFSPLYNNVRNIMGTTMPLALHETGIIPNPGQMFPTQAPWVLFSVWCDTWLREENSVSSIQTTYNHARTITRDELPNF